MDLVILGLNHKTVPVAIREHFTMTPDAIHDALQHLDDYGGLREAVILSTCNRAEPRQNTERRCGCPSGCP